MAASAFTFFDTFREYMGDNTIDMDGATFRITLHTSAASANINNDALSTFASIGSEIADGNGYSSSGKNLTTTWTAGVSAGQLKFDADDITWTASGGNIANIRYALISTGTNLVARAALSTSQFTLNDGSSLTVQFATSGIFTLT